ncbi:TPM domain-containing protein [Limibacter armeniacum]|uniref:TPM domain-containing protein n=1 Tax=Limibacter armeniacum TaxID=466084 RepID=UPI002FE52545
MKSDIPINSSKIASFINEAEKSTSGEIRVHIDPFCKNNIMDRAAEVFAMLNMHRTKLRNGVLFYIAWENRKFAIIGDVGINAKVDDKYWEREKDVLVKHFKNGDFEDGLKEAISLVGQTLKQYFPYHPDLSGELPNDISFGEEDEEDEE